MKKLIITKNKRGNLIPNIPIPDMTTEQLKEYSDAVEKSGQMRDDYTIEDFDNFMSKAVKGSPKSHKQD